jgi:hypothetical protein
MLCKINDHTEVLLYWSHACTRLHVYTMINTADSFLENANICKLVQEIMYITM